VLIALVQVNCSIDQFQVDLLCKVKVLTKISLKRKQMSINLKTKELTLVEVKKGTLPKTKIAEKFGIPKSTLSTVIKNKDKIDEAFALSSTNCTKQLQKPMLEDVEQELLKWFKKARDSNIPLSGALVRKKARKICISNGIELMACFDGWLWRFQKRYANSFV